jgi:hypothetical protein
VQLIQGTSQLSVTLKVAAWAGVAVASKAAAMAANAPAAVFARSVTNFKVFPPDRRTARPPVV